MTMRLGRAAGLSFLEVGAGPAVVLLHGIPGSTRTWRPVAERIADRYRVIVPDLPGFGQSPPAGRDDYMESQARQVRELLAHLGVSELILGGHDYGGPVALTLHRLHPELAVRAFILSATNLFTDTYVPPPLRLASVPILGGLFYALMAGNRAGLRLMYEGAARQKSAIPWSRFRNHLTPEAMRSTRRIFQRSLADLRTNYRDIEGMLPRLAVPTLLLWGDRDPFFALAVAERSQRAIPGSSLQVLADTGHFVPEEQPERVADLMRSFLEGIQS